MTPAILATCGLLYSMVAIDMSMPEKSRQIADAAAEKISQIAVKRGEREKVSGLAFTVAARFKEHPEEIPLVADAFGQTCRELAGL